MDNPNYALKELVPTDAERLTAQYKLMTLSLGRESALPKSIDAKGLSNVLDVATGSMAWILDLAAMPDIQNRLSSSQLKLYACDITTAQFPPQEIIEGAKINVFLHNVTTPFPRELHGTFDLVNMRCMTVALDKDSWKKAIANLQQLLKPGGRLMLCDGIVIYCYPGKSNLLPPKIDHRDHMSWLDDFNTVIWKTWYVKRNFVSDLPDHLCTLLDHTGFDIEEETPMTVPLGALCRDREGPLGDAFAAFEEYTAKVYPQASLSVFRHCIADGSLEGPEGRMSEDELVRYTDAFQQGLEVYGACLYFREIVAKRRL